MSLVESKIEWNLIRIENEYLSKRNGENRRLFVILIFKKILKIIKTV